MCLILPDEQGPGMSKGLAAKITVSLPDNLVDYATKKAAKLGVSRSQVIAEALTQQQVREQEELAAEGNRCYAEEAREFADASVPAAAEAIDDVPPRPEAKGAGRFPLDRPPFAPAPALRRGHRRACRQVERGQDGHGGRCPQVQPGSGLVADRPAPIPPVGGRGRRAGSARPLAGARLMRLPRPRQAPWNGTKACSAAAPATRVGSRRRAIEVG